MFIKEAARQTKFKCCYISGRGIERMGNPALHSRQGISDGAEGEGHNFKSESKMANRKFTRNLLYTFARQVYVKYKIQWKVTG